MVNGQAWLSIPVGSAACCARTCSLAVSIASIGAGKGDDVIIW